MWSLQNKGDSRLHETSGQTRSLMVYRVGEIDGEKYTQMNKDVVHFNLQLAKKEK